MDVPHDVVRQRLEQKVREGYARARKAEAGSWWGAVDQRIVDHQITQDEAIGAVIEELRTEMREEIQQALDPLRAAVKELNDAAKVAMFLLDPHPKMPDMSLTRSEAADLAAYIASLAR